MKRFTTQLALLIGILTLTNLPSNSFSQVKETIYYLADTTNVGKQNQILEIGKEGLTYYAFYCKCIPPYDSYLTFVVSDRNYFEQVFKDVPTKKMLSWRELEALASKYWANFNNKYDFYIIEKLPKGYKMNKADLTIVNRTAIIDFVKIEKPATDSYKKKVADSSTYKLTEKGINVNFVNLSIKVFDTDGSEMRSSIGLRDKKNNPIMNFFTNEKGQSYVQIFETDNIGYITVGDIGYDRLSIPVGKLKNKNILLEVKLRGQSTSN
ncbi:hypothetical protein [Pedobacter metabolipauper]|uniref:Uncharacterized protein n=1 Tax=Pedobacter metabolipauper TaxID=425513 RepID=A0A4R6SS94_9SPHI|nr:hypothetical protein [Pedobacter metabolipauper]TDQ06203.1 hypothetical protein ATK78_4584 [Pedobacter metabolipauper]